MVWCVDGTFEDDDKRQINVFQGVSSILGDLPSLLSNYLFFIGEAVHWDLEKGYHIWRICPLFSGEEGILLLGHDVAVVSICGVVIIFDALVASDDLGTKMPETAEDRSSLYFINRPYGHPDFFYTVFHHACYSHGIREV